MLKGLMASALILGSTLSISVPVMAQTQQSVEGKSYQVAIHAGPHVCTRDRYGYLNIRNRPSLKGRIIGRMPNGSIIIHVTEGFSYYKNWSKINHEGTIGWVSSDYICHY